MHHTPVTPADIENAIASEHYFTAADGVEGAQGQVELPVALGLLTFCVLITNNGHTVTGESHCQDPAKFDAETGRTEARKDAINKLWPMAVYAARQQAAAGLVRESVEAAYRDVQDAIRSEQAAAPARKPYTWADVSSYQTSERTHDDMTAFKVHMLDGHTYEGAMLAGQLWPEASAAMLAECNRQRDLAA